MVLNTNLQEVIWTTGNDSITSTPLTINYGLGGDDSFLPGSGFRISIGGTGNDQYIAQQSSFAAFLIETGNSSGDKGLTPTVLTSPTSILFTIDNRHFGGIDTANGSEIYLIDFAKPENIIETVTAAEGTLSFTDFATLVPTLPGFIGNLTWEDVIGRSSYLSDAGLTSSAKINEVIDYVVQRAASLEPTTGADILVGTLGNDSLDGLGGDDRLLGLDGNDTLLGSSGNDFLGGDNGDDLLNGGDGLDQLVGGDGRDKLIGGAQNDVFRGQGGSDIFVLQRGVDRDRLLDYRDKVDKLGLSQGISFKGLDILDQGRNTVVKAGDDVLAVLNRVDSNVIGRGDFVRVQI